MNSRLARPMGILAGTIALLFALALGTSGYSEVDTWWHLRVGQHVLDTGQLRWTDPWAAFASRPYTASQWLPESVAAWAVDQVGLAAIGWLRALAILSLAVVVFVTARQRAGRLVSALATTLALLGAGAGLNPRPQLVSFVLFALLVLALLRTVADGKPRWWLVALFWVWGCSHGLWAVGLAVAAVVLVATVLDPVTRPGPGGIRRLALLWVACAVAVAATPLGPRLLLSPFDVAQTASGLAEEWRATPVNNVFSVAALLLVLGTALLWAFAARPPRLWQAASLVLSLFLVLVMWRLVPLGAILSAPLFSQALHDRAGLSREPWNRAERRTVLVSWIACLLAAGLVAAGSGRAGGQRFPGNMAAVDQALDSLPGGTVVLDDFAVSGWLLWRHPDLVPVIDLRSEIYSHQHIKAYVTAERVGPGWRTILTDTRARHALLRRDSPLALALTQRASWSTVAESGEYVVLEKESVP